MTFFHTCEYRRSPPRCPYRNTRVADEDRRRGRPGHDRADDRDEPEQLHVPRDEREQPRGRRPRAAELGLELPRRLRQGLEGGLVLHRRDARGAQRDAQRPVPQGAVDPALHPHAERGLHGREHLPGQEQDRGQHERPHQVAPRRRARAAVDGRGHLPDHHARGQHERDRQEAEHQVERGETDHQAGARRWAAGGRCPGGAGPRCGTRTGAWVPPSTGSWERAQPSARPCARRTGFRDLSPTGATTPGGRRAGRCRRRRPGGARTPRGVRSARRMRPSRNHRRSSRVWHHAITYQVPSVRARTTGSIRRRLTVPSERRYSMASTRRRPIDSSTPRSTCGGTSSPARSGRDHTRPASSSARARSAGGSASSTLARAASASVPNGLPTGSARTASARATACAGVKFTGGRPTDASST